MELAPLSGPNDQYGSAVCSRGRITLALAHKLGLPGGMAPSTWERTSLWSR